MARGRKQKQKYRFRPYGTRGKFKSWQDFQEHNRTVKCSNPACTKLRHNRGKYCSLCGYYHRMLGDARFRPLTIHQYKPQLELAKDVISFNKANIIVTDHCEKFVTLANQGKQGLNIEWASWFSGIHGVLNHHHKSHKRDARDYLAHFVAVYMLYHETWNEVIKTERMFHFTLGSIALRRCQNSVRPKATPTRTIAFGKFLWGAFSLYWLKIAHPIMQNERAKQIRKQQLEEAEIQLPESMKESKGD